ncbi:Class II abasic (AP) endonuclease, partial [Quaeritorhiza haematococci]
TRIDYILATPTILPWFKSCTIEKDVMGSDHCPVSAEVHDIHPESKIQLVDAMSRVWNFKNINSPTTTIEPHQPTHESSDSTNSSVNASVATVVVREPPRICTKFWDEFVGKQQTISSFFVQKGVKRKSGDEDNNSERKSICNSTTAITTTTAATTKSVTIDSPKPVPSSTSSFTSSSTSTPTPLSKKPAPTTKSKATSSKSKPQQKQQGNMNIAAMFLRAGATVKTGSNSSLKTTPSLSPNLNPSFVKRAASWSAGSVSSSSETTQMQMQALSCTNSLGVVSSVTSSSSSAFTMESAGETTAANTTNATTTNTTTTTTGMMTTSVKFEATATNSLGGGSAGGARIGGVVPPLKKSSSSVSAAEAWKAIMKPPPIPQCY